MPDNHVIGLFATPFMWVKELVPQNLLRFSAQNILSSQRATNARSALLSHTQLIDPASNEHWHAIAKLVQPKLADFGELLFGQTMPWSVKEMWANVLETGGAQSLHNHANSFVSGVIYLSDVHPSSSTVFSRAIGTPEFVMRNAHAQAATGLFNADKWLMPPVSPGDLILFPSYLLHEVPRNEGAQRVSLAFNAIPERIESWGYGLRFAV